jgi:hypothetical protein
VESTFSDIYERVTGEKLEKNGDLLEKYKKIKAILNLSEDKFTNDSIISLMRSLSGIIGSLDNISNQMGDRHTRPAKPQKHHAHLCVNSAKTVISFLYDTIQYKFEGRENIFLDLITVLDSEVRNLTGKKLVDHPEIQRVYKRTDPYIRNLLKNKLIFEYKVESFRKSDIFFTSLEVFLDELSKDNIEKIFNKEKNNNQAVGLPFFLGMIAYKKFDFFTQDMLEYVRLHKPVSERNSSYYCPFCGTHIKIYNKDVVTICENCQKGF